MLRVCRGSGLAIAADNSVAEPLDDPGFSLIEAMLATLVLTVGVLSLVQLFAVTAMASAGAAHVTMAAVLAAQKVEELRALPWGAAAGGADRVDIYVRRWSVEPPAAAGDALLLTVEVAPGNVRLVTARARRAP